MDDCQRIMVSKETQLAETIDQLTRRIKELETIIKGLEKENRSIRTDLTRSNRQAHST